MAKTSLAKAFSLFQYGLNQNVLIDYDLTPTALMARRRAVKKEHKTTDGTTSSRQKRT